MDIADPKVLLLAKAGMQDDLYLKMIEDVKQETDLKHLPADSELRMLRGCYQQLSIHTTETETH